MEIDSQDLEMLGTPFEITSARGRSFKSPNRIVHQPMEANDAERDGSPGPLTIKRFAARAAGLPGIEIFEAMAIMPEARARENQLVIGEATASALEELVAAYRHISPDTIILFQITHSGPYALSPVSPHPFDGRNVKLLADSDIEHIRDAYVRAVKLVKECGADGVDFKNCHGYLAASMLRPLNAKRRDWSWGGESIDERLRFFSETMEAMTGAVSADGFLYSTRLSAYEGIMGGFGSVNMDSIKPDPAMADLKSLCKRAEELGISLFNQSAGIPEETPRLVRQTRQNLSDFKIHESYAKAIKSWVASPVIGSGYSCLGKPGFIKTAAQNIRNGSVDFVGIGRQTFADPLFARKILLCEPEKINWCTLCNKCALALRSGTPAGCAIYDELYKKKTETTENPRTS